MNRPVEVTASLGEGVELPLPLERVEAAVRHVLEQEDIREAEVSVAFLGDQDIARLNREYLRHEGPTDVISFALHAARERPLGDIYVGVAQVARQAAELKVPLEEELLRMVVHGTLHVLGYEHPEGMDRTASEMYLRQEDLLTGFLDRIGADER